MRLIFKFAFAIVCLIGTVGYGIVLFNQFSANSIKSENLIAFGVGCAIYLLLWIIVLSKRDKFWNVVEHELTHALFALLFFKKVHSFSASRRRGGSIEIEGNNFIIALSPYFFPLFTIFIVIIKPSILQQYQWILNGLMGFTLMFHLVHLLREFHTAQPDLQSNGLVFSLIVVIFFNLFFIGLCIAALKGTWGDMGNYMKSGIIEGRVFIEKTWTVLTR